MNEQGQETARAAVASMLRRCADFLESLPPRDVHAVIRGEVELRLSLVAKKPPSRKKPSVVLDSNVIAQTQSKLRTMNSRGDGELLLKQIAPTKSALETLARSLDLPIRKSDNTRNLRDRIIESTIGYRLASAAIQGKALQGDRETANTDAAAHSAKNSFGESK